MLVVSSDGPLNIDRLQIEINQNGKPLLKNTNYRVPQEAQLPTTIAIVSNGDATAQAQISVTGWEVKPGQADVPLDRRDAIVTQIPNDRVAALTVVLSARCTSTLSVKEGKVVSSCGEGNTCDNHGDCTSSTIPASTLPTFRDVPAALASAEGGEGGMGEGGASGASDAVGGRGGSAGSGGTPQSDPCAGITCTTSPDNDCSSGKEFLSYDKTGSCEDGVCSYESHRTACTCENHACTTLDPCDEVTCNKPPTAACTGNMQTTYAETGTCSAGSCHYQPTNKICPFGCANGACLETDCPGIVCTTPPLAACADSNTQTTYSTPGLCSAGICSYAPTNTTCPFGCANGACKPDPCAGVMCLTPPNNSCTTASNFQSWDKPGSCVNGTCNYVSHQVACTCQNNSCTTDPCASIVCKSPPSSACSADGKTQTTYATNGNCSAGSCSYAPMNTTCPFGCANGACKADPCAGIACTTPPAASCADSATKTTYATNGSCSAGNCSYTPMNTTCPFGCANGVCKPDPCAGVTCKSPPAATCTDSNTQTTFATIGSCSAGLCSYAPMNTSCPFGCANGACKPDPCAGVACTSPPANGCADNTTQTLYATSGTCSAGICSYAPMNKGCGSNKACVGAGVCSVCKSASSCGAACTACTGSTPKCKDLGSTSLCVGCVGDADCSTGVKCDTTTNTCLTPPSCSNLAPTCGPNANADCCASNPVTGISTPTFYRSYDGVTQGYTSQAYPAQVSDFRLDNYEVTVGRFRAFVGAYSQNMIAVGAGKNPNNPSDPGWDTAWNASLNATALAMTTALKCSLQTWKDNVGSATAESLPINCVNWFEAEAFCIWDGGRLPTEAEWNYAAAGGTRQRVFPWGSTVPGDDANLAVYGCYYPTPMANCNANSIAPVGSVPAGNGWYGQSDLAGNMWEWTQDWWVNQYTISTCINCANLTTMSSARIIRGGSLNYGLPYLYNSNRYYAPPAGRGFSTGFRCARAALP